MGNYIPVQTDAAQLSFNYHQRGQDWVEGSNCLEQSPIDIIPEEAVPSDSTMKMELFWTDHDLCGLKVCDMGNTLQVNGAFSKLLGTDVDGGVYEYEAIQFHFHAPAEHTIRGEFYDLELHIVHQITPRSSRKGSVKRNLAVVGIFFDLDEDPNAKPNPFIESLRLHNLGQDVTLNMNELLGRDFKNYSEFYGYKGSLTVPPCSANANWFVMDKPLKITAHQLEQFNLRWKDNPLYAGGHGNNRPVQPLNGRVVMKSKNSCIMSRSEETLRKFLIEERMLGTPLASRLHQEHDLMSGVLSNDNSLHNDHDHHGHGGRSFDKRSSFEIKPIFFNEDHPLNNSNILGGLDASPEKHHGTSNRSSIAHGQLDDQQSFISEKKMSAMSAGSAFEDQHQISYINEKKMSNAGMAEDLTLMDFLNEKKMSTGPNMGDDQTILSNLLDKKMSV